MFKAVRSWLAKRADVLPFWIIGGAILLFVLSCFVCPMTWVWIGSRRAYALAPPQYPNSRLVEEQLLPRGNAGNELYLRIYKTSDDIEDVLTFMEEHMPGFTKKDAYHSDEPAYYHNIVFAAKIEQFLGGPDPLTVDWPYDSYPYVSVELHSNPDEPTGTIIKVWISWPIL